ncbi:MAG: metal-dependent hydrolase [Proteobacteria bacterium]|nr:metal-dependent hydrolase [Pseudomonadota bacterium]MBU1901896.1 metal-dependent hydrolase [Patescibacteria group bacterium]
MTAKGHILTSGFSVFLPLAFLNSNKDLFAISIFEFIPIDNELDMLIILLSVYFGSLLPDIDEPESRIGRKFPIVSNVIKSIFGHRGITHTLAFPLLFIVLSIYFESLRYLFAGIALGVINHILGDMLTKGGIKNIFFPFLKGNTYGLLPKDFRFYTNSAFERFIILPVLFVMNFFVAFYFINSFSSLPILNFMNQNIKTVFASVI